MSVKLETVRKFVMNSKENMTNTGILKRDFQQAFNESAYKSYYVCPTCGDIILISSLNLSQIRTTSTKINPTEDTSIDLMSIDLSYNLLCNKCDTIMFECDPNIVHPISDIIRKGYATMFCCEGHVYNNGDISIPYLLIKNHENIMGLINDFPNKSLIQNVQVSKATREISHLRVDKNGDNYYSIEKVPIIEIYMKSKWLADESNQDVLEPSTLTSFYKRKKLFVKFLGTLAELLPKLE